MFEKLTTMIENEPNMDDAIACLVVGLADRIKTTSNDQNVQALARELRQAAPTFVAAVRKTAQVYSSKA